MYKKANGHDQEDYDDEVTGTDAALIDSYFLPGGILDPEESSSHNNNNNRPLGIDNTNSYKKDSENEGSWSSISPSPVTQSKKLSLSLEVAKGTIVGSSSKSQDIHGQRNVEEEYLLRHNERFPMQNSRHCDNNISNNDLLRSQLEQLAVGSHSFDYRSNVIQRPNSLPIGSGNFRSSPRYLDGEGVSALDPLADSVVGGVGGRPIVNTSTSQNLTSLRGLPSPLAVEYTQRGVQGVTPAATGTTAIPSAGTATASASTSSTTAFGDFTSSDWFSSCPTTGNMANISRGNAVEGREDFSNFLRQALLNRGSDLNAFTSSSFASASDTKSHSLSFQRHHMPSQKMQSSSLGSCADQDGSLNSSSVTSSHPIQRNPWKSRNENHDELTNLKSFSQSSTHRPAHLTHKADLPKNHNTATSLLPTKATTDKSSLPTMDNSKFFLPMGDGNHRVNPPPGFLSSSSTPPPMTSTIPGKSTRETFQPKDDAIHISGTQRNGTLQGRTSKSAQELRCMPFTSEHRQPDTFGVLHPSTVVQSPNRTRMEDEQRHHLQHHHRNQQSHVAQSPGKNQQKSKAPSRHHNDGDYDLSSLNTKMSRDVPSTIYVEEDALSTSEDTLTVCADSVTETSLPNRSHGKAAEYDRNGMDAVQEIEAVEKRSKAKRSKKKRTKKKHQVQESVASQDTSTHPDQAQLDKFEDNADEVGPRSEEESKETKKVMKSLKESKPLRKQEQPLVMKTNANSRSSGTATEPSSSAETILHSPVKKDTQHKAKSEKSYRRNTERRMQTPTKPRGEPWLEIVSKWCSEFIPVARNAICSLVPIMNSTARSFMETCKSWFPKKERFWFLFPMCCVSIDLFFLFCAILCKTCGQVVYLLLMTHKLALMELVESEYTAICYSVIFFYPDVVKAIKITTNQQYYCYIFVRWLAIDRFFCRPITIKDTYLHNIKRLGSNDSAMNVMKHSLKEGKSILPSFKAAVDHIIKVAKKQKLEESERIKMANHILLILRRATPLIMILESHIHRSGFLVLMTNTERILFGYGIAVLRTGYLFSPLIWISWTIQLTIIMFANSSSAWCYFILMLGLVSIRLSHYSAAVEDLDGVDAMNSYSTAKRRRISAYSYSQYS